MQPRLAPPWLHLDLGRSRRVLSFAPYRPGFVSTRRIIWRQVRDDDLTQDFDAYDWLARELAGIGQTDCVAMLTSRGLEGFVVTQAGPVGCLATVGLGNAERVGHRLGARAGYGTINIAVLAEAALSDAAMIEALSIIAEARTAAIIDAGLQLPSGRATGTGTDCIALAADPGETRHAGTHTALGEALGRAVYDAVLQGARDWIAAHPAGKTVS